VATFRYKAASSDGEDLEGEMKAIEQQSVIRPLQADPQISNRAEEGARRATCRYELSSILSRRALSARELNEMTFDLVLERLVEFLRRSRALRETLVTASIYPLMFATWPRACV
jgi:type II secretory pathway component PulF